jgi:hypothetical protein
MQTKLDGVLRSVGSCCVLFATLCLALGIVGRPLERPWIAYSSLAIGVLAYTALAMRGLPMRSTAAAILIYGAFGAVCGTFAIRIGLAIASKSWGIVTALVLISMLVGGVAFWWKERGSAAANK